MANLFDQYERATQESGYFGSGAKVSRTELNTFGFVSLPLVEDEPIFHKTRISNLRFPATVTHMTAQNNHLAIVMVNKVLLLIDASNPQTPDEIDLTDKAIGSKISHLFMDPTGRHLLISVAKNDSDPNANAIYLLKRAKLCNKIKGHVLTAVGWNPYNTKENTTGSILLGTSKGLIFETELMIGDDRLVFQSNVEACWKQAYDVSRSGAESVTGIQFHHFPDNETKYFVLVTTPSRLYQFIGNVSTHGDPPVLYQIFVTYTSAPDRFTEIPGSLGYSQLQFFSNPPKSVPKSFAWMTGAGVFYGLIDCSGKAGQDSVMSQTKLIPYPLESGENWLPLSIALTEFHVLMLFQDRIRAICLLNEQLVFQDIFIENYGKVLGLVKDVMKNQLYAYSERSLFMYTVTNEARNVWEIYLDKGDFESAKENCKNNPVNMDKVLTRQAASYFSDGKFEESADIYAQSHASFEEISLKFLSANQTTALKTFLIKKMAGLKSHEKTQLTMIVTWVIELYLNQLGSIRDTGDKKSQEFLTLRDQLHNFLQTKQVTDCVSDNRSTFYNLISSHGDQDTLIFVTFLMKDYDRVISYYIHNRKFIEALKMLLNQKNVELFYQYSPALMQACPQETVEAWISQGRRLNPTKLIPALLQCDHGSDNFEQNVAVRYLEYCVQILDNQDTSIHNYLVSLYARLNEDKLMSYLNVQGQDSAYVYYDLKYALRVCSQYERKKACVLIYAAMGLYEEAVDLALQIDVDLAKQNADRPEDDSELRKKLWLKIARHVVEKGDDIKRAMEFLQECDLIKIEDILPFFPDFVTIDNFKDAICTSLQEYNQHIDGLQEEMEDATESAQEIRNEIQAFRNRYAVVRGSDKCSVCSYPIATRAFYLFPCEHKFHADCLSDEITPHLTAAKRYRVKEIGQIMAQLNREENIPGMSKINSGNLLKKDQLKTELDELIAAECLYCGEIMIRSVDKPFIQPEDLAEEMKGWD